MRSKGLGALVLSAAMIGLAAPASALAAKPAVTTGAASKHHVLERAAQRLGRSEQGGHDVLLPVRHDDRARHADRADAPPAAVTRPCAACADISGLAPVTKYYYRLVAHNASGTTLGKRRSFTTRRQPLGVTLAATPNPVKAASSATTLFGNLSGTGNAGRKIVLQASAWPFTTGFVNVDQRAGHQRHRRLLVPDPVGRAPTPSTGCRCLSARRS